LRRPISFIFLAFISGITFQYYVKLGILLLILSSTVFALIFVFVFSSYFKDSLSRIRIKRVAVLFLLIFILGCIYFYIADNIHDPLEMKVGQFCNVYGRVLTVQIKEENYCNLLLDGTEPGKRLVKVQGAISKPEDLIGKMVKVKGIVELPSGSRNPGLFDYKLYLKTKGVRIILSAKSYNLEVNYYDTNLLLHSIAKLKYRFMGQLKMVMKPESYGLLVGMLFGDRTYMSDDTYEAFQNNGIAHILSVSGIHVAIVYIYLNKLLRVRRSIVLNLIAILMLILYAALSEFSPSVVRSVVMIVIHIISKLTLQRYDFTTCASFSAFAMLLVNPFYLFNTGFQLSFMAIFCLSVILPWANRKIDAAAENIRNEMLIKLIRFLAPLCVIQIGMAPLTAYLFNYFSIASFFMNIPIIALSGVIIPIGMCLIPLSYIGGILFGVGAAAAELLIDIMTWLNDLFYFPGIGFFNTLSPAVGFIILYYSFIFFLTSEFVRVLYQRKKYKIIVFLTILIFFISIIANIFIGSDGHKAELIFVDVGQGDCLHIRTPGGKNILIDGGGSMRYNVGKNTLLPYLLKNKVESIDLAIVSHLHDDHYLGLTQLAKKMEIKKLGTYEANKFLEEKILSETGLKKEDMIYLAKGNRITIEKDIWIDIIYPEKLKVDEYEELLMEEKDENKSSLLIKIYYKGLEVLMTGDMGLDGEEEIMKLYEENHKLLTSDILKIGHHGSRYSTSDEFINAVAPKIAIFQVGKNNFGHPHPTVIEKCKKHSIMIFRNDLEGAIMFHLEETDDKELPEEAKWHIKTQLKKNMHLD